MAALIGLVLGALAGHFLAADWGTPIGGLIGFFAGAIWAGQRQRAAFRKPEPAAPASSGASPTLEQRLAALEARIAQLERERADAAPSAAAPAVASVPETAAMPNGGSSTATAEIPPAPLQPEAQSSAAVTAEPAPSSAPVPPVAIAAVAAPPAARGLDPAALWRWFTGGNAMTRIGVVVLFFGVAFLLRYFAEHFTIPIAVRLLAVAAVGVALIVLGLRIGNSRPAYGWSLQAAGAGVLYLTGYAAHQQFHLLSAGVALGALAAVSGLTILLALLADAEALAALALTGAFLGPILTDRDRDPTGLFGYFAAVNAVVLLVAWLRPWRAVTLVGAAFTFVLGLWWGDTYYRPEHFRTVEPFLVAFFAMYLAVAVVQARFRTWSPAQPLDGLLVFGVPLAAFALQTALVADTRYGAAYSAAVMAVLYAALALVLRRRPEAAFAALARYDAVLAVIFASLALAFAFDHRTTAALWAIEGALVFWAGLDRAVPAMRAIGVLLQLAAGLLFATSGGSGADDRLFLNAFFFGVVWLAAAGLGTAYLADRHPERLLAREATLAPVAFAWGALWWLLGGGVELVRLLPRASEAHAVLAWVTATTAVALVAARVLAWARAASVALALAPAMILIALRDLDRNHTTLLTYGWALWPAAWMAHLASLRAADRLDPGPTPVAVRDWRTSAHVATALALVAHVAWEASEWAGRVTADDTVWVACAAALPAIAYVAATRAMRTGTRWPFVRHPAAYADTAALPIAIALGVWIVLVNLLSPGEPFPLPYVPLLNPLDLALALALAASFMWARAYPGGDERRAFTLLGIGVFVSINGAILRIGHHLGGIPWDMPALLESRPLQAALTLAWTTTAVALMFAAARRAIRPLWMIGAVLLALVVVKLFALDLNALSGLPRVIAFLGVGSLLLLVGYLSPLPPSNRP